MRTDSNRLLVGGVGPVESETPPPVKPFARRQLAEIIVAVLIVATCIYIFVPVFMGTAESARRVICVGHLRRLAQAMEMYQQDADGLYPPDSVWMRALYPYVLRPAGEEPDDPVLRRTRIRPRPHRVQGVVLPAGAEVFFCPSEENLPRRRNAAPGAALSSYEYRQPPSGSSAIPFAWDYLGGTGEAAHPGGGNVAFLDGRVAWRPSTQWAAGDQP
jgi:prepilin-type processing-associated H-X9-DG protein